MALSPRKYLLLVKIEGTQFVDPTAAAGTNAILVSNLKVTPLRVQSESRNVQRAYLGNSEQIPVMTDGTIEFDVEVAGSGAAGTAPKWGPLMRMCGFAETLVASTSAAYNPVSAAFESGYIKCYRDGLLYKMSGAKGSVSCAESAKTLGHFHFTFTGKYVAVSDAAIPSGADYSGFQQPKAAIPANMGTVTIGGYAAKISAFSFDMANEVSHAVWINNETLEITDRAPKGSLSYELPLIATNDYFTAIQNATLQAFTLTHGTSAGNIVTIAAPKVQLVDFSEGVFENTLIGTSALTLNPNSGNDEIVITCT